MFCLDLKFQRSTGKIQIHTLYIMMLYMLLLDIPLKWFKTDFYNIFRIFRRYKMRVCKIFPLCKKWADLLLPQAQCMGDRASWIIWALSEADFNVLQNWPYCARPWVYQNFQVLHRGNFFLILHTYLSFCLHKNRVTK